MRQSIHDVDISFQLKMQQLYSTVFLLIYSITVHTSPSFDPLTEARTKSQLKNEK